MLNKQEDDACSKTIQLGDEIEEKEKEKDRIERNKSISKSKKRKLQEIIPSFASRGNVNNAEVTRAKKQTLFVGNNTIELLDSGNDSGDNCESEDDDDDDELLNYNSKPASK